MHEGANFRFGHQAEAGVTGPTGLQALGRELGFSVTIYDALSLRGGPVSSGRIRALIAAGGVSQARALLGRPFAVDSTPASGRGFGARYAVPTINLAPYPELLPAHGVYVTTLAVGSGPAAETFQAVTNVGVRPTFGAASFAVESHLLDFHPIPLTAGRPRCASPSCFACAPSSASPMSRSPARPDRPRCRPRPPLLRPLQPAQLERCQTHPLRPPCTA